MEQIDHLPVERVSLRGAVQRDGGELQLWAASRKVVEEIAAAIEIAFEVKLAPLSVGAQAVRAKIAESALAPTAALLGLSREEVRRGEA